MNVITIKDIKVIPLEKLLEESRDEIFQYYQENENLCRYLNKALSSKFSVYENSYNIEDIKIVIRHLNKLNLLSDKYKKKFRRYI